MASCFAPLSLAHLVQSRDKGEQSSKALLEGAFARLDEVNGQINAFQALPDAAMEATQSLPLSGIAVGVKDLFDTCDYPTEYGSSIYRGHQPKTDAAIVAMLCAKGASIFGKTTTTEFAFLNPTDTRNPVNPEHSPGGSSSGSAAAVAAGIVPLALGTQTGGSVVRPAAYCGICGFKPSYRLLPTVGIKYFAQSLDTTGIFTKSVKDAGLFLSLLTDRDLTIQDIANDKIRVGFYQCTELEGADTDMLAALAHVKQMLSEAGISVIDSAEPEKLKIARDNHATIQNFEAAQACASDYAQFKDQMSDILISAIEDGMAITPQEYDSARKSAKQARRASQELFSNVDILISPSAPGAAPKGLSSTGSPIFNKLWTLIGGPAINIPGMQDKNGMPLGIQATGRFGNDKKFLSIAHKIERLIGGK